MWPSFARQWGLASALRRPCVAGAARCATTSSSCGASSSTGRGAQEERSSTHEATRAALQRGGITKLLVANRGEIAVRRAARAVRPPAYVPRARALSARVSTMACGTAQRALPQSQLRQCPGRME